MPQRSQRLIQFALVCSVAYLPVQALASSKAKVQAKPMSLKQLVQKSLADMKQVPGGTYLMGASDKRFVTFNNTPAHKVRLISFYISKYNVSYGKYDSYTHGANQPLIQKAAYKCVPMGCKFRNAVHPVDNINWHQANNYCEFLAKKTGLPYSLPTEAQWEYVARNNGKPHWHFATNNGKQELGKNFPDSKMLTTEGGYFPMPVGSIPCTPQAICGLNGQVNQWVKDWYAPHYYSHSPVNNPKGPKTGTKKVMRSAGPSSDAMFTSNLTRGAINPDKENGGFRCVINSTLSKKQLMKIAMQHIHS